MTTDTAPRLGLGPQWTLQRDHMLTCECASAGTALMRWTPDDPIYRPGEFDTPPHEPRRSQ